MKKSGRKTEKGNFLKGKMKTNGRKKKIILNKKMKY